MDARTEVSPEVPSPEARPAQEVRDIVDDPVRVAGTQGKKVAEDNQGNQQENQVESQVEDEDNPGHQKTKANKRRERAKRVK
jgi:hypothetical protein